MKLIKGIKAKCAIGAVSVALLVLAGCGGGGSADNSSSTPTLATAAASVEGLLAYMKVAVATTIETTEPIDISTFVAPTSDTTEPDPSV